MGASLKSRSLTSIYSKYASLFSRARIISVRSLPEWFITTSTSDRLALFKPIVPAIRSDPSHEPRILVHLFSNGGSLSLVDTCATYKAQMGHSLPLTAIILDSAPGQPTLKEGWAALSIGLPKGLLWYPSAVVLLVMIGTFGLSKALFGKQSIVDEVYNHLNDGELVSPKAARLYIYSEKDELVGWRDVERHGKTAGDAGVVVDTLRETDTPHVQHVIKDTVRYWAKVESFWERVKHDS